MGSSSSVPANYSAAAYALLTLDIILSTGAVTGRIASRKLMKATPAIDDYLCYLAFVVNIGLLIFGLVLTAFGAFDLDDVSAENHAGNHLVSTTTLPISFLYIFAITFIKLSILFFYRRTFTMLETWFRWCWVMLLILIMLWTAACITLLALQETGRMPRHGFMRLGISTTGIVNGFSDMLLMILPAVMVYRLKLQKKQKIALISIFGLGGVASVVSLVRGAIYFRNRHHKLNEAYCNYLDVVLTATESSAGLMCACLPLTKPVVISITRWLQRLCGLDTKHQGWTTRSQSAKTESKDKDRTIMRVDDYHVQLLPISKHATIQTSLQDREVMSVEKPWQSVGPYGAKAYCESNVPRESGGIDAR